MSAQPCQQRIAARLRLPNLGAPGHVFSRVALIMALLLLPVQMRAGAHDPHPHALFQLLLDAHDGVIDHHHHGGDDDGHHAHDGHGEANRRVAGPHDPDVPTIEAPALSGNGMPVHVLLVALLVLPRAGAPRIWAAPGCWRAHAPTPEPPPPRA